MVLKIIFENRFTVSFVLRKQLTNDKNPPPTGRIHFCVC